jgi:hypothetical protein
MANRNVTLVRQCKTEKGWRRYPAVIGKNGRVALGVYARVMQVLRLEGDLALTGVDDKLGRKLQDAGIAPKLRAPKRSSVPKTDPEVGAEGRD